MADNEVSVQMFNETTPTTVDDTAEIDCESLTGVDSKTVYRQRIEVAGAALAAIASVTNSAPTTEYGLVVRNIPSGTQTVSGTVTANLAAGTNNIGDVDVLTVPAPLSTTGGGTEATALRVTLANDSTGLVSVDDNAGSLTVDNSTLAVVGGGTEAAAMRVTIANDSTGVVSVDDNAGSLTVDGTVTVTGVSTLAEQQTQTTALQLIDDIVKTDDVAFTPATDKVAMIGAEFDDTLPDSVNEGDAGALRMSANRNLYATIRDAAGNERGVNVTAGNALTVDGSATTQPISAASLPLPTGASTLAEQQTQTTALQLIDDTVATTAAAIPAKGIAVSGTDGTNARMLKTDAGGELQVDVLSIAAGTNNIGDVDVLSIAAGDNNIGNVDIVTMPNVTLAAGTNTNEVVGDIAHDTGVGGNPLQIAAEAKDMDDTAPPNVVSAESDTTRLSCDRDGALFIHTHGPRVWSYHENSSSALTDTSVHAAPAAGLSLYVTDIVFSTGAATACNIFFEEGASTVLGPYYLEAVAGRGLALHFQTPKKITAATALTVTTSAAIAHSIDVTGWIGQG